MAFFLIIIMETFDKHEIASSSGGTESHHTNSIKKEDPTEAEIKLKEDAGIAKNKLMKEIENLGVDYRAQGEMEEEKKDPLIEKFTVQNPSKKSGHVVYEVRGVDEQGEFIELRRFREFDALSKTL